MYYATGSRSSKGASIPRLLSILILAASVSGCTRIERVNVLTVAVDCDVQRGDSKAANGGADADILTQQAAAAAAFTGSLHSNITCSDGTKVEAGMDGADLVVQ